MLEIWKNVKGYEDYYQVSNKGRIKSLDRTYTRVDGKIKKYKSKIRKLPIDAYGYNIINLFKGGKRSFYKVHRLVAYAFLENIKNKPQINHKNGIKTDNNVNNLEWVTCSENLKHAHRLGFKKPSTPMLGKFGKNNHSSKKIVQYNLSGKLIKTYYGISEACRENNYKISNISMACRGKSLTAYGFRWSFVENRC